MAEKEYIDRLALLKRLCGDDQSRMEDYYYNAIAEYPAADVVELPLNIGDVVYASKPWYKNGALLPYQITCLTITQNKKKQWCKNYRAHLLENGKTIDAYVSFSFDEIGKEVFLTNVVGKRKEVTPCSK